jgi:hypothetical protein
MAERVAVELVSVKDGTVPALRAEGAVQGGKLIRFRATIELAASGNGDLNTGDSVLLGVLPAGAVFAFGQLNNTATLGASAQVAIGTNKVHASNGQYRASAVKTTTTIEDFGLTPAQKAAPAAAPVPVYLTVGVADLPTSGTIVVDIYASVAG